MPQAEAKQGQKPEVETWLGMSKEQQEGQCDRRT